MVDLHEKDKTTVVFPCVSFQVENTDGTNHSIRDARVELTLDSNECEHLHTQEQGGIQYVDHFS